MLKLEVISYRGSAPPRPISAQFDKTGGGIGRGDTNTLVLADAERFISRTHAKIAFLAGGYTIDDRGTSTPVILNGRALGKGGAAPLRDGDEIGIGEYVLRVMLPESASPVASHNGASGGGPVKDDPLALYGGAGSADPFADLIPAQSASKSKSTESRVPPISDNPFAAPAALPQRGVIPADFDPFADFGLPAAKNSDTADLLGKPGSGSDFSLANENIDDLFGLTSGFKHDVLEPGGTSGQAQNGVGFDIAPSLDPMAPFNEKVVSARGTSQRNDTPELYSSFSPPKGIPDRVGAPTQKREFAIPEESNEKMILSWNEVGSAGSEIKTLIIAPGGTESIPDRIGQKPHTRESLTATSKQAQENKSPQSPGLSSPSEASGRPERPSISPETSQLTAAATPEVFFKAFLEGAGVSDLNMPSGVTPQTMHMLGQIFRESIQGTLDLLLARAMTKREVRAELTMIVAKENNPLKFSPNVEAAIRHILAPQRGFMPPLDAMKDAYDDLRSHQIATMAGMRAALAGVLLRFTPERLEQRLTQRSVLDSVLPLNRKAKLWNLFSDLFEDISKEAEDDFHTLFGREFLRAYEAQIDQLQHGKPE